jgi:hypothetical protein
MSNVHGKDITLKYVTVKVPGQRPRGSRSVLPRTSFSQPRSPTMSAAATPDKDEAEASTNNDQAMTEPSSGAKKRRRLTRQEHELDQGELLFAHIQALLAPLI